ncbi:hypothetical protein C8046_09665 [Serinibacter arcticus]|uniref:ACT domain-containing protein n=1 Tax=Serinibacter arcticus TaxID=1655435 RepID=A0A2U1ZV75_9MICO|nr:hypothetical protein [Serinibacter arcticus]PWD50879.1 hypothetical protein C8046_09665 [Serinibacter arcticus]
MRYNRESIPDSISELDGGGGHEDERRGSTDRATVIVTVEGDLPEVLPALREAGLVVERTLTSLSIVVGTVDVDGERAIASISGVHVEREQTIALGPPGGPQ